jgi:LPXTG-site transpeptidase (sortase) family protein
MPEDEKTSKTTIKRGPGRSKIIPAIALGLAVMCFATGGKLLVERYHHTHAVAPPPQTSTTITEDIAAPSESKVSQSDADAYTVPADQPRSIALPSIGASGLVQRIGLTKDHAVAVPSNVAFAGWYTLGVKPGESGLSIIDGHVSGKYSDGIFKKLKQLKAKDQLSVEFGDKSKRTFEVVSVATFPEDKAAAYLFEKQSNIDKQLNLITCGGAFNRATQHYEDRVIVVTKLVS